MERNLNNTGAKTLQEALALQTAGILAILEIQQELLRTVREIQIGDDVIGSAAARYRQKMAVVQGGGE